jgi:hypothetical protein
MLFKQSIIAALMASASLVLALPAPNTVNLSVRDEDSDAEYYKRSTFETFVCKRDDKYEPSHHLPTEFALSTHTNIFQQPIPQLPPQEEQ